MIHVHLRNKREIPSYLVHAIENPRSLIAASFEIEKKSPWGHAAGLRSTSLRKNWRNKSVPMIWRGHSKTTVGKRGVLSKTLYGLIEKYHVVASGPGQSQLPVNFTPYSVELLYQIP